MHLMSLQHDDEPKDDASQPPPHPNITRGLKNTKLSLPNSRSLGKKLISKKKKKERDLKKKKIHEKNSSV